MGVEVVDEAFHKFLSLLSTMDIVDAAVHVGLKIVRQKQFGISSNEGAKALTDRSDLE